MPICSTKPAKPKRRARSLKRTARSSAATAAATSLYAGGYRIDASPTTARLTP
jgi:hypothetical protein